MKIMDRGSCSVIHGHRCTVVEFAAKVGTASCIVICKIKYR